MDARHCGHHDALIDSENINVKQLELSRLLLKPLNETKHGGDQKMLPGDMTYKAFRAWLDDDAKTVNDSFALEFRHWKYALTTYSCTMRWVLKCEALSAVAWRMMRMNWSRCW